MIHSMTGYAAASRDLGSAVLNLELKSVNSRYLDIGFRLGEDLRFLEMPLREKIAERIARGKIEMRGYLRTMASRTRLPVRLYCRWSTSRRIKKTPRPPGTSTKT